MSGRLHPASSTVIAVRNSAYTAATALVRAGQFAAAFVTGYAASYGLQVGNAALMTSLQWLIAVNVVAWVLARRLLAGWWATALGLSGFFLLAIPRLLVPVCPAGAETCVVSPMTYVATVGAVLITAVVAVFLARHLAKGRERNKI